MTTSKAGIGFLRTEAETAMVFARIASEARDPQKRLRNVRNARTGYKTLLHFMKTVALTADERAEMQLKISGLRQQLINLLDKGVIATVASGPPESALKAQTNTTPLNSQTALSEYLITVGMVQHVARAIRQATRALHEEVENTKKIRNTMRAKP